MAFAIWVLYFSISLLFDIMLAKHSDQRVEIRTQPQSMEASHADVML